MEDTHHLGAEGDCQRGKPVHNDEEMRDEYDFSQGERGKFYRPDAVFSFPIYLDPDVNDFLTKLAEQKQVDVQDLVNEWLRLNMKLVQTAA